MPGSSVKGRAGIQEGVRPHQWALPLLAIAGLRAKDIMGFCLIHLVITGAIIGTLLGCSETPGTDAAGDPAAPPVSPGLRPTASKLDCSPHQPAPGRGRPRLRTHSQKMTVAARAMAEGKTLGHRS